MSQRPDEPHTLTTLPETGFKVLPAIGGFLLGATLWVAVSTFLASTGCQSVEMRTRVMLLVVLTLQTTSVWAASRALRRLLARAREQGWNSSRSAEIGAAAGVLAAGLLGGLCAGFLLMVA